METFGRPGTWRVVLGAMVVLLGGACGTVAPSKPVADFPSPEALARISAKPTESRPQVDTGPIPAEGWTVNLAAAGSSAGAPWSASSNLDRALLAAVAQAGRQIRFTQSLSCAAGEMGRYLLSTGRLPPDTLRAFMIGACGGYAPGLVVVFLQNDVPADVPEQAVLASFRSSIRPSLVDKVPADAGDAGFSFVRGDARAAAVLVYAQDLAQIDDFSSIPDEEGRVTVSGQINSGVQYLGGYINHGRFGVAACFIDPTVTKPRFRISCQVAPEDEMARIDLLFAPPRRALASPFAQILARKKEVQALTYRPEPYAEPHPVNKAEDFAPFVVQALNRVRSEAGLGPVRLAAAQSDLAASLALHYFAAWAGQGSPEDMDTIALGLLAGRQVTSGMIRSGSFASAVVTETRDAGQWLTSTLAMPIGRSALLASGIEEIALGPVTLSDPDLLGAVVVGYQFHHGNDHTRDVKTLTMRTVLTRRQRKLSAPLRLGLEQVMNEELAKVHAGKQTPMQALDAVMYEGSLKFSAGMRGYVVEAASLDELEIPGEILAQPNLHLEIGVTHHRPPGAAWGQFVILVVFIDYGQLQTAMVDPHHALPWRDRL